MAKTATKPKPAGKSTWQPESCESCSHPFGPAWESDYSMSGELVWICPRCKKENYPPINEGNGGCNDA